MSNTSTLKTTIKLKKSKNIDLQNKKFQLIKGTILVQSHFFVNGEKYHVFMQILERPLSDNAGFKKLMGYKASWKSQLKT
ncbi:hypothetical protein [Xenorhabdus griffiniae]|uniref:Transposase n=1 Tax=Xenorhabdus griffiniae TaxID=351672 RepID=A0ABY9XCH6_9GAMM|nr:hypothetical protein [Xenorhabdus griffiniae]MBD1226415.1 hypothetical protein [Xenorhabdus griffiniae]MBE8589139.1 hypothetical protein [Xenorhabdus griffiniae]WMV70641.1 hypothetical protein QL128_10360 [Xenorhabdus griffiniae]WNH00318.1 hypothetical protein QL112_010365 [Xenorhabdus griffiniae]